MGFVGRGFTVQVTRRSGCRGRVAAGGWRTLRPVHGRTGWMTSWTCPVGVVFMGWKGMFSGLTLDAGPVAYRSSAVLVGAVACARRVQTAQLGR